MIQDAKFTRSGNAQRGAEPEGFKWEANGIGSIVVTPHVTAFDFTVEGYNFKAHLTKEVSLLSRVVFLHSLSEGRLICLDFLVFML